MATSARPALPSVPVWRRRARTAVRVSRERGRAAVAFLVAQRLAPRVGLHAEWFAVTRGATRASWGPPPRGEVRWADGGDLRLLCAFGHDEALVRRRLAAGDRVAILHDDDELLAFAWYRRGVWDEHGILVPLADHEVWGYDVMVAEGERGRRLSSRFLDVVGRRLAAEGVTDVIAGIDHLNRPALRAARARGVVVTGSILMLKGRRLSVRREAWRGRRARWRAYRGAWPVDRPGGP